MKLEPNSLNISLPPSSLTWQSQRFFLVGSALLSLLVIWPSSLTIAVLAVLVGTPLFWLMFGTGLIHRVTSGKPTLVKFVIVVGIYLLLSLVLGALVKWLASFLGSYV
jgi:hypothetical protein